jgi:hypothetical protein
MQRRTLLAGVALLPLLAAMPKAIAAKLPKTDVKYQDQPNAGKDCDDCIQFVADATRKNVGTCKVVEGQVSAQGYCLAFTPKPKSG